MVLSRRAVAGVGARATTARLGGAGPWVLALPMTYVAGLQVVCRSLVAGHRPVLLDDHASLAAAVAAAGGAPYVSLVATQLLRALEVAGRRRPRWPRARPCWWAAARSTRRCASGRRRPGSGSVATYGSAETAGGCVYDGLPLDGVAVAIGADGRIRIGGPTLFDGYDGDPALTAEVLVDGWFLTADARSVRRGRPAPGARPARRHGRHRRREGADRRVAARLREHPAVTAAEVVGVPDEEWGKRVVAWVVGDLSLEEARDWVARGASPVVGAARARRPGRDADAAQRQGRPAPAAG